MPAKIFLDSSDPKETREIQNIIGFLDGQTTNPTNFAKSPSVQERIRNGEKFTKDEVYARYKKTVQSISSLIPHGSVSVEVHADLGTTSGEMIQEAREMFSWIPNAHIKLPITSAGLGAAEVLSSEGVRLNMTLCFSQTQAAAVHAATKGAPLGNVFISPFIGRLDDIKENGADLLANIIKMYQKAGSSVEVLAASIRNMDHIFAAIGFGANIITASFATLREWGTKGKPSPHEGWNYNSKSLRQIPYYDYDMNLAWQEYDIAHPLTSAGLNQFAEDWNALMA